jgi:hypothetical protein
MNVLSVLHVGVGCEFPEGSEWATSPFFNLRVRYALSCGYSLRCVVSGSRRTGAGD